MKGKKVPLALPILISIVFLAAVIAKYGYTIYTTTDSPADAGKVEAAEAASAKAVQQEPEQQNITPAADQETEEISDPITTVSLTISDIYAEEGEEVIFYAFYEDAVSYTWKVYDMEKREWTETDAVMLYDELEREVSAFKIPAVLENNEKMIRCSIQCADGSDIIDTASLYVLDKKIKSIEAASYKADIAEGYVSTLNVPVTVHMEDNTSELITGLYGLRFIKKTETTDDTQTSTGNHVRVITTELRECNYLFVTLEEQEAILHYPDQDDISLKVRGSDTQPPVIAGVEFSSYEVSCVDHAEEVTASIIAEDDVTPYPHLEYAMYPADKDVDVSTIEWSRKSSITKTISNNGIWNIGVRDSSGNIAVYEKEFIIVDQKPPVITVELESMLPDRSNTIIVTATDKSEILYCYSNEQGIDSGWIDADKYSIEQNGIWSVSVKDAAGNITTDEIEVYNIDTQPPIILEIMEEKITNG